MRRKISARQMFLFSLTLLLAMPVFSQATTGTIRGTVTLEANGGALHKARVLLLPLGRTVETGEDGAYEFKNVPPGSYELVVSAAALRTDRRNIQVDGSVVTADFEMKLAGVREQIVVTAEGKEQTAFESFQSSTSLESLELVRKAHTSIGEALENEPGAAKRSFGPGSSRPVLRGFDGDRVLVMLDGLSTGSLASQSGDHGENLDVLSLERVEIVRGPATLLYGSNAIGGVVNAISGAHQIHEHPHDGLSGFVSGAAATASNQAGGGAGFEYGHKRWIFRAGGGGQRTGDYDTPIGEIPNSQTRNADVRIGTGYYGERAFFSAGYDYDNRRYGVPFAVFLESGGTDGGFINPDSEVINLRLRRQDVKFTGGVQKLNGAIESVRGSFGYVHYRHGEFDDDILGTDFFNKVFNYRVTFEQKKFERLSGSFGVSGQYRDYNTVGAEALAPPVTQKAFALFALETLEFPGISFQFGGRFEHTGYDPGVHPMIGPVPDRTFNGASGALGIRVPLWTGGAFVANYTHSFRAPALEELYNFGPHPGNVAFEIGDPNLKNERGDGVDFSIRQRGQRVHAEANLYYYRLRDFVFLAPNGNVSPDGFIEAEYLQARARYLGGELNVDVQIHPNVWLQGGMDIVNAETRESVTSPNTLVVTPAGTPLPRIPPLRGRVAVEFTWKGLSIRPEGIFAAQQDDIFPTETVTNGHQLFNLGVSYTVARQHDVHVFSINAFNLNNQLYRNHLSFIKELAPEIGRGVRFGYTVRFM